MIKTCGEDGALCGQRGCPTCDLELKPKCFTHFWVRRKISKNLEPLEYEIYCEDCGLKADDFEQCD